MPDRLFANIRKDLPERTFVTSYSSLRDKIPLQAFIKLDDLSYEGTFAGFFTGSYTSDYSKTFTANYTATYQSVRFAAFARTYEGVATDYFVGNFDTSYTGSYAAFYEGVRQISVDANWSHVWQGTWNKVTTLTYSHEETQTFASYRQHQTFVDLELNFAGFFESTFIGNYSKNYVGLHPLPGTSYSRNEQFVGFFEGLPLGDDITAIPYVSYREGPAIGFYTPLISQSFTNTYQGEYVGSFLTNFLGTRPQVYTSQFQGFYEGVRTLSFTKLLYTNYSSSQIVNYVGTITVPTLQSFQKNWQGNYLKTYQSERIVETPTTTDVNYHKVFVGSFSKIWTSTSYATYSHAYIGTYTNSFSKIFTDMPVLGYFIGQSGTTTFSGIQNYVTGYAGLTSYIKTYQGTTTYSGPSSGNLPKETSQHVKKDDEWKDVSTLFVKKDDEWKRIVSASVMQDGEWHNTHIDYEQHTIDFTASKRIIISDELDALSASYRTVPQKIVLNLMDGLYNIDLSALNHVVINGQFIQHLVKIVVHTDAQVLGGYFIQDFIEINTVAIRTSPSIRLWVENYGTISGTGGNGGNGNLISGFPPFSSLILRGGFGDGLVNQSGTIALRSIIFPTFKVGNMIDDVITQLPYSNYDRNEFINGGDGGKLGYPGTGAGASPGQIKTPYINCSDGTLPSSAISGYGNDNNLIILHEGIILGDEQWKFSPT